jgi:hypothetical protein
MSGVRMIHQKEKERVKEGWKGEVGVGDLVADGLGRREKRGACLGPHETRRLIKLMI